MEGRKGVPADPRGTQTNPIPGWIPVRQVRQFRWLTTPGEMFGIGSISAVREEEEERWREDGREGGRDG